jgi:hypothetical protein
VIILSPALTTPTRQAIVTGRAFERFTQRGLDVSDAALTYQFGIINGPIHAKFLGKSGGYFALQLDPSRNFPDMIGAGMVTLELTLTLRDGATETLSVNVPEADLILTNRVQQIAGTDTAVAHLPGAPITFDFARDPAPVGLDGQVFLNGNPATPAAALTVTVGAQAPISTDADGRFRSAALPLTDAVVIAISDGTDTNNFTHHLDYSTPLNRVLYAFLPDED